MSYDAKEWDWLDKINYEHNAISHKSYLRKSKKLPVRDGYVRDHYWRCTSVVIWVNFKTLDAAHIANHGNGAAR